MNEYCINTNTDVIICAHKFVSATLVRTHNPPRCFSISSSPSLPLHRAMSLRSQVQITDTQSTNNHMQPPRPRCFPTLILVCTSCTVSTLLLPLLIKTPHRCGSLVYSSTQSETPVRIHYSLHQSSCGISDADSLEVVTQASVMELL
ncbi:hypothetical protein QTG54_001625 [Skeletonema marinoi]|uniref:Uncharacterized protein n=1 Tax=Skeletonema marinoi TaxID=267567 RepID=A0AAD8YK90_9STRA|nr:hypothetical protein QTG54_001625 [Skeletonema marinoi]